MRSKINIALRIIVALILINTLRYKFSGHEDSIYIFSKIGMEPLGRIGLGILELISAILLLIPKTVWMGALVACGILAGAIVMHLTILGIEIKGDGGLLFITAVGTFLASSYILYTQKNKIFKFK